MNNQSSIEENYIDLNLQNVLEVLLNNNSEVLTASFDTEFMKLDDELQNEESFEEEIFHYSDSVHEFNKMNVSCPLVAIDVGATKIGDTSDGAIVAYRGCIIKSDNGQLENFLYRTGPILLSNRRKKQILHKIGKELGNEELFVYVDEEGAPVELKKGVADNTNQYADRIRNFIERKLQQKAVSLISNGIVLIDGAMTKNTRDTPTDFIEENILKEAYQKNNRVIAISKKSTLLVDNIPIRFALNDKPNKICYRNIQVDIEESNEGYKRNFGNMYVARFSEYGQTFRVDVCVPPGEDCRDVLDMFWTSSGFRNGYPELLVRAHWHTYIPWSYIVSMQSFAKVKYNLQVVEEIDYGGAFAPFGGGYK
ncbi:hypothetical protein PNH38_17450 [Anoxybacillus rupiensis]|uniref:NurA domain-containing protein n=1 Tax=Anoxybacteroides rupiense TaxID=311460 RepID=A0ABD5IW33_9BACL|nr:MULTISPECIES: hypothetical protein [Anoxybacillus]MBS2773167.1 hypothetical protein [Anoxybacillus rupiensis]MDE8565628.1 hypothetical protein [Anoxybacillus rupiensis]MED5052535.1 hypothetical protein [Anoxybacillus rupiensis]QHC02740.1 hypothetical protein GRQ40_01085 [Anoxybacillus sp. PDR2]